jgi:hypothetical protein
MFSENFVNITYCFIYFLVFFVERADWDSVLNLVAQGVLELAV